MINHGDSQCLSHVGQGQGQAGSNLNLRCQVSGLRNVAAEGLAWGRYLCLTPGEN